MSKSLAAIDQWVDDIDENSDVSDNEEVIPITRHPSTSTSTSTMNSTKTPSTKTPLAPKVNAPLSTSVGSLPSMKRVLGAKDEDSDEDEGGNIAEPVPCHRKMTSGHDYMASATAPTDTGVLSRTKIISMARTYCLL